MKAGSTLNGLMRRYGRKATLHLPDGWYSTRFYCFLQPLRYKNKMYLEGVDTEIGFAGKEYYLYLGPAEHDLQKLGAGVTVRIEKDAFTVSRSEKIYLGEDALYIWAVLIRVVQEDEAWG